MGAWMVGSFFEGAIRTARRYVRQRFNKDERALVQLMPKQGRRGYALLAHVVESFEYRSENEVPTTHTHFLEAWVLAATLLKMGFAVDIISYRNTTFVPRRRYDILISSRVNFERLANLVGPDCIKILHLDVAHWLYNNSAALHRALDVQRRRGVTLDSVRCFERVWAIESADCAFLKGNQFTYNTYSWSGKQVYELPNPAIRQYAWPEHKDFTRARRNFLWLGSRGYVHKGLDLVLEAFAAMPEFNLVVCGNVTGDKRFCEAYSKELHESPNIRLYGWIDVASPAFEQLANGCIGFVYASASEGCAGSVITCIHAGLIPIVSYQSGVDVPAACGRVLSENSVAEIQGEVRSVAALPERELRSMAKATWDFAQSRHTRERYALVLRNVLGEVLERGHKLAGKSFKRASDWSETE